MTLPHPVIEDQQVQQNFEALAALFPAYRISWGLIKGSDGSRLAGSGDYTPSRGSAGIYTITWSKAKKGSAYMVLLTTDNQGGGATMGVNLAGKVAASFGASVFTLAGPTNADPTDWSFLVIDAQ